MKKMNLLVMSLVSAAALSFTSCSSNDDLDGNNLYKFTNYNIVKCNPNNSKDIIIGPAQMTLEDITCSKEENSQ